MGTEAEKQICKALVADDRLRNLPRYCGRAAYTAYAVSFVGYSASGGRVTETYRNYYCDACLDKVRLQLGENYEVTPL